MIATVCFMHGYSGDGACPYCAATVCENCGKEPSTENWGGTHDSVSLGRNPRLARRWCRQCVVTAQVEHMRTIAAKLPALEKELADIVRAKG